jgi:hypothetical protein
MGMSGTIHNPRSWNANEELQCSFNMRLFCLRGGYEPCAVEEKSLLSVPAIKADIIQAVAQLPNRPRFRGLKKYVSKNISSYFF